MFSRSSFRVAVLLVVSIVIFGTNTHVESSKNNKIVVDNRAQHEKINGVAGQLKQGRQGYHYPKQTGRRFHKAFSRISNEEYALNEGRKDHCKIRQKKKCVECNEGYFGKECRRVCSLLCKDGCRKEDGSCRACSAGNFGLKCNKKCPVFCGRWNSRIDCDQLSGHCSNGCRYGYWGVRCRNMCDRCLGIACIFDDGTCLQGCTGGYTGKRCKTPCPRNCKGYICNDEGHCTGDCKKGFWGKHCNQSCEVGLKENICETDNNRACQKETHIVILLLILIVIVSIFGLIWIAKD